MAYKILPFAEIDLLESVDWYSMQQPGLDVDFLLEIRRSIHYVNQQPYAYQVKYRRKGLEIRQAPVERFPYVVAFFVDEPAQLVVVLAIWHTARNLKKLKSRL
jgi:plasmid stabilization system protein ParE